MSWKIIKGDCRESMATLEPGSVQCCVTSPPYWGLRDYGHGDQLGLEARPDCAGWATGAPCGACFVCRMVEVFRGVRRVLRDDGTLWLNLGDCYATGAGAGAVGDHPGGGKQGAAWKGAITSPNRMPIPGLKPKDLCMVPARVALALQSDGWWLRSQIVWHKRSCMPESCTDRPTSSWESLFLLTKSSAYYYDAEAVKEASVSGKGNARTFRGGGAYTQGQSFDNSAQIERESRGNEPNEEGTRNLRNVWTLGPEPFPGSHFAVMPTKLVTPCILAGTSEHGCCSACGAPWGRVMERTTEEDPTYRGSRFDKGKTAARDGGDETQAGPRYLKRATGWAPGCDCSSGVVPCTVLDPFSGAGTVGVVATRHCRSYIGLELNPEYAEMSRRRIEQDAPLFNRRTP